MTSRFCNGLYNCWTKLSKISWFISAEKTSYLSIVTIGTHSASRAFFLKYISGGTYALVRLLSAQKRVSGLYTNQFLHESPVQTPTGSISLQPNCRREKEKNKTGSGVQLTDPVSAIIIKNSQPVLSLCQLQKKNSKAINQCELSRFEPGIFSPTLPTELPRQDRFWKLH